MTRIASSQASLALGDIETQLRTLRSKAGSSETSDAKGANGNSPSFFELLRDGVKDVNSTIQESDKASLDMASGKPVNLHQTMLSVTKAELSLNLAVQMRNKVLEAYQEVMRMQV